MTTKRNYSKKRAAILEALEGTCSHPTAGTLYTLLKEKDPDIGIATVYRNLDILESEGSVVSLGKIDGQERYDADTHPHGHFICRRCGAIFDFEITADCASHEGKALLCRGFSVDGCEVRLMGLCPDCSSPD